MVARAEEVLSQVDEHTRALILRESKACEHLEARVP